MSLGISSSPSSSFGDSVTPPEDKCSTTPATSSGLGSHFDPLVKRKRNKPTLNCRACVERKTKCDRERPGCGACLRRGTDCQYQEGVASSGKGVKQLRNGTNASQVGVKARRRSSRSASPTAIVLERLSTSLEPLLSNIPYPTFSAINIYGIGSEHPFKNYWTLSGGLEEVISVLPSKEQADILIAKYFDAIDSIFPLLHEGNFYAHYEEFWRLSPADKAQVDTAFVALLFVMLALGSQLLRLNIDPAAAHPNQYDGAEFYASACHQALHLGAYLNRTSVPMLQAMVLMTYFLMNANRGSDGWAFQGIVIRQAYAMGLNRDPNLISKPKGSLVEQQEKRRLWRAVVCQDASMSVVLKLPPGATHADDDLKGPMLPPPPDGDIRASSVINEAIEYCTGIPPTSFGRLTDIGYCNGMYSLALLEQETIASPRSLSLQLAPTFKQRIHLIGRFQACYNSWPAFFRTWDEQSLCAMGTTDPLGRRVVRQIFFLTSHYWHCVMLIHVEGCDTPVESLKNTDWDEHLVSMRGALEAAHSTLRAFFVLPRLLEGESGSWWTMAHRAFAAAVSHPERTCIAAMWFVSKLLMSTEQLTMANLLKKYGQCPSARGERNTWGRVEKHYPAMVSSFSTARRDVSRTIGILKSISHHDEASKTCVEILENLYGSVDIDMG